MQKKVLGKQGEDLAALYLKEAGYEILARNYQRRSGEVDVIARDPESGEIAFVEVKTRYSKTFGYPEDAVTETKLSKIEKTALEWLGESEMIDILWRIDIMALELGNKTKITHLKNVTL